MGAKLQVKLYAEDASIDGEAFIPLFHGWIRGWQWTPTKISPQTHHQLVEFHLL